MINFFKRKPDSKIKIRTKRLALCLGGGGARGFAHIGAVKAFEEMKVDFDMCVGTSAGSIVGALYCAGIDAAEMERYGSGIDLKEVHNGFILMPNDPYKIGALVTKLIGNAKIEDFKKRFYAMAVDLVEAKQVIIEKGNVGEAVSASCAVPMFFRPVIKGREHLSDGGLLNNIPADICRMLGADYVVTVDINPTRGGGTEELGLIDVLKASFSIMSANSSVQGLMHSDVIIAPDLSRFKATSKTGYKEMIELGYEETMKHKDEILTLYNT